MDTSKELPKASAKQFEVPRCAGCGTTKEVRRCPACRRWLCGLCEMDHFANNPGHDRE